MSQRKLHGPIVAHACPVKVLPVTPARNSIWGPFWCTLPAFLRENLGRGAAQLGPRGMSDFKSEKRSMADIAQTHSPLAIISPRLILLGQRYKTVTPAGQRTVYCALAERYTPRSRLCSAPCLGVTLSAPPLSRNTVIASESSIRNLITPQGRSTGSA